MSDQKQEAVYKFTLSSGKILTLREMRIEFQELAAKACASKAGDNAMLLAVYMQKELLKILIAQVDGKVLTGAEKENLNTVFSYKEYSQAMQAVKMVIGDEDEGKPQMEIVVSGNT